MATASIDVIALGSFVVELHIVPTKCSIIILEVCLWSVYKMFSRL